MKVESKMTSIKISSVYINAWNQYRDLYKKQHGVKGLSKDETFDFIMTRGFKEWKKKHLDPLTNPIEQIPHERNVSDFTTLENVVRSYMEALRDGKNTAAFKELIFKKSILAFYKADIFKWIKSK